MALVSKDPDYWKHHNIPTRPADYDTVYRILHLRDAVFLDDMYFRGRKAAEDYLHKHLCEISSYVMKMRDTSKPPYSAIIASSKVQSLVENNKPHLFDIVEV